MRGTVNLSREITSRCRVSRLPSRSQSLLQTCGVSSRVLVALLDVISRDILNLANISRADRYYYLGPRDWHVQGAARGVRLRACSLARGFLNAVCRDKICETAFHFALRNITRSVYMPSCPRGGPTAIDRVEIALLKKFTNSI